MKSFVARISLKALSFPVYDHAFSIVRVVVVFNISCKVLARVSSILEASASVSASSRFFRFVLECTEQRCACNFLLRRDSFGYVFLFRWIKSVVEGPPTPVKP